MERRRAPPLKSTVTSPERKYTCRCYRFASNLSLVSAYYIFTDPGCVRATPFGFMKVREEPDANQKKAVPIKRTSSTSSSLPDSTLWDMGRSYSKKLTIMT